MNIRFTLTIIGIFFLISISKTHANPTGKSVSCHSSLKENLNYKNYKGISFETERSVRVVTLKMKNNKLKVVSKLTPYKIKKNNIYFKIKFIWYGNIFFEEFNLNRDNLDLINNSKNQVRQLKCKVINGDFMAEMNKVKEKYQSIFQQGVGEKINSF